MSNQIKSILKKSGPKSQERKSVSFSRFTQIHYIENKEELFNSGEINKVRIGRFLVVRL